MLWEISFSIYVPKIRSRPASSGKLCRNVRYADTLVPSAGMNRVPADEADLTNIRDNKRRQKLKRKKTVETHDEQTTDESEDDQCPNLPLPSAGPDL